MLKLAMLLLPQADRRWSLAREMGIRHAIAKLAPELTGEAPPWDFGSLEHQVGRYREAGFRIAGLEGDQFDMTRIKLGLAGRDEDLERYRQMLSNMGRLGIELLCYNFMPLGWLRNRATLPGRGGAVVTGYRHEDPLADLTEHGIVEAEAMWDNYTYFLNAVLPAAEAAGVRMAMHPDDPPAPMVRGISRILTSAAASRKALDLVPSPSNGLTFCQGTYKTMGEDVREVATRFGREGKIFYIHIRDIRGDWRDFVETFPDDGDTDMAEMFRIYRDIGFDGLLRPDHAPAMTGSPTASTFSGGTSAGYEAEGMIYTVGYIKGLLHATGIPFE